MDLNEIMIFTRVAQHGSFTAAAKALSMPKSTVSRKVAELEDRIGVQLLQRTTRKLGLTDFGRRYYEHGLRIVSEAEEAERAMAEMHAQPCGRLRVTAPLSFSVLSTLIGEYLQAYPKVSVELSCLDRIVDLVEEGYDLAIRVGELADSSLTARKLGTLRHFIVASPKYLAAQGTPTSIDDLSRHDVLGFSGRRTPDRWTLYSTEAQVEVPVRLRFAVNDFHLLREMVRQGLGLAELPSFFVAEDLRRGQLVQVLPAWCSAQAPVHAIYPNHRHVTPRVTTFVELLRARLRLD